MLNLSKYNRFDALIARNEGCLRKVCRLYGGDNITDTALAAAAEQLSAAEKYKTKKE